MSTQPAPRFVWYDLMSSSPAAAESFYGRLFGWTTQSWTPPGPPGESKPYTMWRIGESPFGGVIELPQGVPAPSHWYGHVAIPDLDAAIERGKAGGGSFPAGVIDVPTVGRMAPMLDPQGAFCSLFTPASPDGMTPVPGRTEGMVGWNELMATDVDAAQSY
jgi:predicted enzyme related to lactoylglutathione lyase